MDLEPFDAVVAGHVCLDIIPDLSAHPEFRLDALLRPGHLVEIGPAAFSTGGPVSNTGLALHRLGIRTLLMGKVGNHLFGQGSPASEAGRALPDGYLAPSRPRPRRFVPHMVGANRRVRP